MAWRKTSEGARSFHCTQNEDVGNQPVTGTSSPRGTGASELLGSSGLVPGVTGLHPAQRPLSRWRSGVSVISDLYIKQRLLPSSYNPLKNIHLPGDAVFKKNTTYHLKPTNVLLLWQVLSVDQNILELKTRSTTSPIQHGKKHTQRRTICS